MKLFVILFLIVLTVTFSKLVINEFFFSPDCKTHAETGAIYIPEKCYQTTDGSGTKLTMDASRTKFTLLGRCNEKCQDCEFSFDRNATCDTTGGISTRWRFGIQNSVSPTGYYIRSFSDRTCKESSESGPISFRHSEWCGQIGEEFVEFKWNDVMDGLEMQYKRESCENRYHRLRIIPVGVCQRFQEGDDTFIKVFHKI